MEKYNPDAEKLAYGIAIISTMLEPKYAAYDDMYELAGKTYISKQIKAVEYALEILREEYRRMINGRA